MCVCVCVGDCDEDDKVGKGDSEKKENKYVIKKR